MWSRVGAIKGGVPLGYSTLGGFTISDQLDDKSGFRLRRGSQEDSGYGQSLSGNLDNSSTGGRSKTGGQRGLVTSRRHCLQNKPSIV